MDQYTMGKIAAHAYVDELQRLNLGYAALVEKNAQAGGKALTETLAKWQKQFKPAVGQLREKVKTVVPPKPPLPKI